MDNYKTIDVKTPPSIPLKEQVIYRVICAMNNLEKIISHDLDIYPIYEALMKYLKEKCPHDIITDSIDVTPDRSVSIRYCRNCYLKETDI